MNKKQIEKLYKGANLADGFDTLLEEVINDYKVKYDKIDNEEKLAYEMVEEKFTKKRDNLEEKEEKLTKELKDYLKKVEKYSTFELDALGGESIMDILTDIITLFKGREYDWGFFKKSNGTLNYLMIFPKEMDIEYEENIDELIDAGIVLDFDTDYLGDDKINFYEAETNGTLSESLLLGFKTSDNSKKHEYILEFIDLVVKYRMEKQSDDISFIELKRLEQAFIYSKTEEIAALNRKRSQEEREELEQKIQERDALLDNYIYDNFDIIGELPSEVALGNVSSGKVLKKLIEKYNETCEK